MWHKSCALILALALSPYGAGAQEGGKYSNRSLSEALTILQAKGLQIVFSTAVVRPSMMVREEPHGDDPREILEQLLEPHGLRAQDSPGGAILVVPAHMGNPENTSGSIRGIVTVGGEPVRVADLVITVEGTGLQTTAVENGRFVVEGVLPGRYTVSATSSAFTPQNIREVEVRPGRVSRLRFDLVPVSVFLSEVIVTPSHFRLLDERPESRQFLDRKEVRQMPHVADDLYRAVKRLPGSAGGDFTAKINVRGGEQDELLVILDGLELYEPFHLKDFQSVFSIIDSEAVGGVDFLTGGYPVEYGDRMSGVMDISVATPSGPPSTAIDLSTMNARFLTQGTFNGDHGDFFVSARAWYPDTVAGGFLDTSREVDTDYFDVLTRVQHDLGRRSRLALNLLAAYDNLGYAYSTEDTVEEVRAKYTSYDAWLNLRTAWSQSVYSQTVLSVGRLTRDRVGLVDDVEDGRVEVDDGRSFSFAGIGQDWTIDLSERHILKAGFDAVRQEALYDYRSISTFRDPDAPTQPPPHVTVVDTYLEPEGTAYSLYLADRFQFVEPLVIEIGLRWDRQTWVGEHQFSPRINLMYSFSGQTTFRAAWGRFHQSQRLNELQVEDGVDHFFPAQLANHWLVSVEHSFRSGFSSRIEIFRKDLSHLRPRYENLFSPIELFPEAESDRILVAPERALVRGLEIMFKGSAGSNLTWWASYVLARAEDRIEGSWEPRSWDQKNSLTFGLNLNLPRDWTASFAGTFHTGWPTTPVYGEVVSDEGGDPDVDHYLGARNSERYPSYARVDTRIRKEFPTTRGSFTVYLEVINLTNRENVCCTEGFEYEIEDDNSVTVTRETRAWVPMIPTVGVGWRF